MVRPQRSTGRRDSPSRSWILRLSADQGCQDCVGPELAIRTHRLLIPGEVAGRRRFLSPCSAPRTFPYAEASWTQGLGHWTLPTHEPLLRSAACPGCWCRTTQHHGHQDLPLRAAINRSYAEMAAHYNAAILPARPHRSFAAIRGTLPAHYDADTYLTYCDYWRPQGDRHFSGMSMIWLRDGTF
jgi:hypothetical protein